MGTPDRFCFDSHKLLYHPDRVARWLEGENIFPIYIEVGLSRGCNHRCVFCAFDYVGYTSTFLPAESFYRFVRSAARNGVKSIMFAGEGEPLLHPDISSFVVVTKKAGIDVAISSNAVLFTPRIAQECLPHLTWFRASIDAGTARTYARIHRAPVSDFATVLHNLEAAVRLKRVLRLPCDIGAQFLLIRDNYKDAALLVRTLGRIGLDYAVIKPYSAHPSSRSHPAASFSERELRDLERGVMKYARDDFHVFFRSHAMNKKHSPKPYARCSGMPFITFLSATGDLSPCSNFVGVKRFSLGNICREPFDVIWRSRRKRRILDRIARRMDVSSCRIGCRLDEVNTYLWDLRHPGRHVNFI